MYKIDAIDPQVVDTYASDMAAHIKPVIDAYLKGQVLMVPVGGHDKQVVVLQGTLTHKVLSYLSDINNLKSFLMLDVRGHYKWVQELKKDKMPDDLIFKKLGSTTYNRHYNVNAPFIDHFNEIVYDIFVTNGYESYVNTTQFIQNTGIRICPYCGNDKVRESSRTKNELDHFLPKRKYPLFAVSYYNLIPSCHFCNRSDHKGQLSPIDEIRNGLYVMSPYVFNPSTVRFHLDIADVNVFEPENFNIVVGFSDKRLLDGYDRFFDISDRYADNKEEASEDYRRFMDFWQGHYYNEMNVDEEWLKKAYHDVLGYNDSSSPYKKAQYRMRTDFFKQLHTLRKPKDYFVKGMGNNTVTLK